MYFKILLLVLLTLVLGCTSEKEAPVIQENEPHAVEYPEFPSVDTGDVFAYECEGDSLQFAAYETTDSAWVFLPDSAAKLDPVKSASGAKFGSGGYLYWSKGDEALLQIPGEPLRSCQSLPKEKSWQAAKIRGVDFRALGQEPGWYLEVLDGKRIKYVGNYGEDTLYTPVPDPDISKNKTEYHVETGDHKLTVEITNKSCTDSMSGFEFPATVLVSVDGETYRGCGKAL